MPEIELQVENPIRFSDAALTELKRLQSEQTDTSQYLRIGVKGGGCSGLSYILAFDKKGEKDVIYKISGLQCIINPAHLIYLANMVINWEGGLSSRGFTFENPNASTNCGCGSSFAV